MAYSRLLFKLYGRADLLESRQIRETLFQERFDRTREYLDRFLDFLGRELPRSVLWPVHRDEHALLDDCERDDVLLYLAHESARGDLSVRARHEPILDLGIERIEPERMGATVECKRMSPHSEILSRSS